MENPIKFEELIDVNDEFVRLTAQVIQLNEALKDIKTSASGLKESLSGLSGANGSSGIGSAAGEADRLAEAQKKLEDTLRKTEKAIADLNKQKSLNTKEAKLMATATTSEVGSYNQLSAQYSLAKIKLNAMSQAMRETTVEGKALEAESARLYAEMTRLQANTGKHTLSVGNYKKAWDGLGNSASQLTRELPSLAMSANMFFLAISNNIPIMADEINRLKIRNAELNAEGIKTPAVWKSVLSSFMSFNTVMMVGVALLTMYGGKIVTWIGNLFKSEKALHAATMAQKSFNDAQKDGAKEAVKDITSLKILYNATQDHKRALDDRKKAVEELQTQYPRYFGNMTAEEILAGKASKAYNILSKSIIATAMARAMQTEIEKNSTKLLEEETKQLEVQDKIRKQSEFEKSRKDIRVYSPYDITGSVKTSGKSLEALVKEEGIINRNIQSIKETNRLLEEKIKIQDLISNPKEKLDKPEKEKKGEKEKTSEDLIKEQEDELKRVKKFQEDRKKVIEEAEKDIAQTSDNEYQLKRDKLTKQYELDVQDAEAKQELYKGDADMFNLQAQRIVALSTKYSNDIKNIDDDEYKNKQANIKKIGDEKIRAFDLEAGYAEDLFNLEEHTENEKTKMKLDAEKKRIQMLLDLNKSGELELSAQQIEIYKKTIEKLATESKNVEKKFEKKDIYEIMGIKLKDEEKDALNQSISYATGAIKDLANSYIESAQAAVRASQDRVSSAEKALDREKEAKANGYAYNTELAEKELAAAKKQQDKALKQEEKAKKASILIDSALQASSLITATANLWKAFSPLGLIGIALAVSSTALMWGSFAAAKAKALSVTKSSSAAKNYGEGGIEFLEGGSHSSGNDIPIGTTKDGRRRNAEGGEAMIIINKKRTAKYKHQLPDIVNALNKGIFEQKYMSAFSGNVNVNSSVDLSNVEKGINTLTKQGERRIYTDSKGRIVEQYKNLRRVIA